MSFSEPIKNYAVEISKGNIPGHSKISKFGHNPNVNGTWVTVSPFATTVDNFPLTASSMTISSDDVNDISTGTGARKIKIIGLDSNYQLISEEVLTNGLTGVATVNSYLRIIRLIVKKNAGGGGLNVGNIFIGTGTITAGQPANIFGSIPVLSLLGIGQSLMGFTTVPAGRQCLIKHFQASISSGKTVELMLRVRPFGEVFNVKNHIILFESNYHHPYDLGLGQGEDITSSVDVIDEKSDIEIIAVSSASGTTVSAGFTCEMFNK